MKKYNIATFALCALIAASAAFASGALDKDTLLVGTESTYPPFEFRTPENELVGYDIDIVNIIAERLGKKIEWVDMSFDGLIPALMTHKIDIIAACMRASPERKKKIDFSEVTNPPNPSAFFVLKGNEKASAADFEGKTIAVQIGTLQYNYAIKMKDVTVKTYQRIDDCMREVLYGRVDATLLEGNVGWDYCVKSKDVAGKVVPCAVTDTVGLKEGNALGIAKDEPELLAAIDKVIIDIKATGEFQTLREKWHLGDWLKEIQQ